MTRLLVSEFMYRPRPTESRACTVFDYTLNARLKALDSRDILLIIANSTETLESLQPCLAPFIDQFPIQNLIVNPSTQPHSTDLPEKMDWDTPEHWRQYRLTDRWCRILAALEIAGKIDSPGWLVMPAHDAVYNAEMLSKLIRFSESHTQNGLPAAVSPYTYYQHSAVPSADIPDNVIDMLNMAFGRDSLFRWKIRLDQVQGFWGKMGMIPFGMCEPLRKIVDTDVWEDDLQIDSKLRRLGYGVHALWESDPTLYRQALPVFDRAGVWRVIERTLHYSLNIPSATIGESTLNRPLDILGQFQKLSPRFRRLNREVEAIIMECNAEIRTRLDRYDCSWVDWGAYRYVMRVGDPAVQVWGKDEHTN
jgi:hypothetical protein